MQEGAEGVQRAIGKPSGSSKRKKPESVTNSIAKWVSRGTKSLRGVQRQRLW